MCLTRCRARARHCESGLTLIELLITITIVGILAAIALPAFTSSIQQNRLRLVVDTIVGDFREASSIARSAGPGETIRLEIAGTGSNWSYTVNSSTTGVLIARDASGFSGDIQLEVTSSDFADADGDGNRDVAFNYLKRIDSEGAGTLALSLGNVSVDISRNLVGLVSLCSDDTVLGLPTCGN